MKKVIARLKVKEIIIHPFAFAVFPILSLYAKNMGSGFLREVVGIVAGVLVFVALLWLLAGLFVRNRDKSAIIVSALCVLFFSYGHAISAFRDILERMQLLEKAEFLVEGKPALLVWLAIWGVLFVAVSCFSVRPKSDLRPVSKFLNIVALTLVVMVGVNLAIGGANMYLIPRFRANAKPSAGADQFNDSPPAIVAPADESQNDFDLVEFKDSWQQDISVENTDVASGSLPDMYYIILDAYARTDILEEIYQFDNSEILSYLAEKGFYVADGSVTNYPQTSLSVASSFNFIYLDDLADQMGTETDNRQPLHTMIKYNRVFQYLRNHGYTILALSSGYGATDITNADIYMAPPRWWNLSEFQEALIMLTPLSVFRKSFFDVRRDRVLYAFDHVADATQVDGPTFVFVHIIVPHWPFIFDADGRPIDPPNGIGMRADYEYDEFIAGYRDQLAFVNKSLQTAIDEILVQSSDPPIIIVQADHGPDAKLDFGWKIENTYLPERMSI
ncbi:MAG TPA: hypothetical protein EYP19_12135, partial [Desulfobacterales bacterium]|nr:hypothetical protein [Desulfobacterales bacterium]